MFAKSIVGTVNATAAGWGNLGGGVTQLVMPYVMLAMLAITGYDISASWRLSLIVPLAMHILSCIFTLTARDLPDGNYRELESSGAKQKVKGGSVAAIGFSNINAWILVLTYGLCFGVELTMNNKVVMYFFNYYGLSPQIAGLLGSCFGLMNLVARSWGGLLSDVMQQEVRHARPALVDVDRPDARGRDVHPDGPRHRQPQRPARARGRLRRLVHHRPPSSRARSTCRPTPSATAAW